MVTIVQGKCRNVYYLNDVLMFSSTDKLSSDVTQIIMGLGFEYTYLERYDTDTFPDKLSDLE